ncbi:MAG: glucose-1-phosphate thymidylyltransferase RfbA [Robiginitomaculum sp.]|nr:glucose-1-phosphate thymidylyltransferase RfbA [Robiginitomaculum sp.]
MKGIILAGGSGTRLHPMTLVTSKQLLPVYDKPMIYYPLNTLMLAGIRDILIITTKRDLPAFQTLLKDGSDWGISISYTVQPEPKGLAQAYTLGADFVGDSPSALILGDNIFHGSGLSKLLQSATKNPKGARVFAYQVRDPERYGVVEFDTSDRAISLEEKPNHPRSNWAVTGLYFYDNKACEYASELQPSKRGELEITDLNRKYLEAGNLQVEKLGRGYAWLDTGTPETLSQACEFIKTLEIRQGTFIGSPEETAYRMGYIGVEKLIKSAAKVGKSDYGRYLQNLALEEPQLAGIISEKVK